MGFGDLLFKNKYANLATSFISATVGYLFYQTLPNQYSYLEILNNALTELNDVTAKGVKDYVDNYGMSDSFISGFTLCALALCYNLYQTSKSISTSEEARLPLQIGSGVCALFVSLSYPTITAKRYAPQGVRLAIQYLYYDRAAAKCILQAAVPCAGIISGFYLYAGVRNSFDPKADPGKEMDDFAKKMKNTFKIGYLNHDADDILSNNLMSRAKKKIK